jgi:hypothetical protein
MLTLQANILIPIDPFVLIRYIVIITIYRIVVKCYYLTSFHTTGVQGATSPDGVRGIPAFSPPGKAVGLQKNDEWMSATMTFSLGKNSSVQQLCILIRTYEQMLHLYLIKNIND